MGLYKLSQFARKSFMVSKYLARDPISVDFPHHYRRYKFPTFKPDDSKKWFENPKNQLFSLFVCSGITIYLWNQETIPYTNRTHLVFMSAKREQLFSEIQFEEFRKGLSKWKTLAANHPDTLRFTFISRNLIDALTQSDPDLEESYDHFKRVGSLIWKRGRAPPETRHVEGLHWEVFVIDSPESNVICFNGGKIVFLAGITKHFENDAEIAALIAHSIGHVVARHLPEQLAKDTWKFILKRMLYYVLMPEVVDKMAFLSRKPFSKEMEEEANYIGLMLMALAGYDPSAAISANEKMEKAYCNYEGLHSCIIQVEIQTHSMEKAMKLYRSKISDQG